MADTPGFQDDAFDPGGFQTDAAGDLWRFTVESLSGPRLADEALAAPHLTSEALS